MANNATSPFDRARDSILQVEQAIQDLKSELNRKEAMIQLLRGGERQAEQDSIHALSSEAAPKMSKGVYSVIDLQHFLQSPTCGEILSFLGDLNGTARELGSRQRGTGRLIGTEESNFLDAALSRALALIDETPPEELDPQRFGNKAFRKWHAKLVDEFSANPQADEEFLSYFTRSFGDPNRLDFGTGHEATFLFLMLVLYKRAKKTSLLVHFLETSFPRYLQVVRRLRSVYRLEPAGSHGVWSLDDYHFLPFIFGTSQMCGGHTRPKDLLTNPTFGELTPDMDFLSDALLDILRSKRGPFKEHSPLLHSLRNVATWEDLNVGLMKMWRGEVLGKFPVAQHFLFGPSLPITWEITRTEKDESNVHMTPMLPSDPASTHRSNNDPLAKYFQIFAHHHQQQQQYQQNETTATSQTAGSTPFTLMEDGNGIEIGGWKIKGIADSRISGEKELDELKEMHPNELDFPLPEMLFSKNYLELEHSNVVFRFSVDEALRGCRFPPNTTTPDRKMIKVPMADKWIQRKDSDGNVIKTWREDYDWTFTTRRLVTVLSKASPKEPAKLTRTPRRIDYERLKQREPILWSKEVLLFEDDLLDLGISKLSVKIRVMPSCYFVLARFFLRVDGVYLRCFDSRIFHVFETKHVLIENSERESEIGALLGGTAETKDLVDPNYVATILPLVQEPITFEVNLG